MLCKYVKCQYVVGFKGPTGRYLIAQGATLGLDIENRFEACRADIEFYAGPAGLKE